MRWCTLVHQEDEVNGRAGGVLDANTKALLADEPESAAFLGHQHFFWSDNPVHHRLRPVVAVADGCLSLGAIAQAHSSRAKARGTLIPESTKGTSLYSPWWLCMPARRQGLQLMPGGALGTDVLRQLSARGDGGRRLYQAIFRAPCNAGTGPGASATQLRGRSSGNQRPPWAATAGPLLRVPRQQRHLLPLMQQMLGAHPRP